MKTYKITENNITYDIIEYDRGIIEWYKNDKFHRENGPAVEYPNGDNTWYKNGKLHREDGPAVEWTNIIKEYWYNGCHLKNINSDKDLKRYIKLQSIS